MPARRTLYDILNVSPEAETVVIEAAYRALMKKYHPDQGAAPDSGAPSAADINQAFAVLRDGERRAEYDRREWTRQQTFHLAAYPALPPPRRAPTVFGWGGWLVALLLGGVLVFLAGKAGGVEARRARAEAARTAALAQPDLRTQPSFPKEPFITPAEAAEIRREALALPNERPAPAVVEAKPIAPVQAQTLPAADQASSTPAVVRVASKPIRRRVPRRRSPAQEKDFLEQQGGIY